MITRIQIRDFVLIDHLDLTLGPGLTVLTGETGAGKSILVDAIGLALGGRADGQWVRRGRPRAEITLTLDLADQPRALAWLEEQDLDEDDDPLCILRRTVRAEGGSRAYINGRPATAGQLRALAEHLVDIHGQHQHQSLLRPAHQQALLDAFGGHQDLARQVAEQARAWQDLRSRLEALERRDDERERRLDFLRYQVEELERLAPAPGEWETLTREHDRLANLEGLLQTARAGLELLREGEDAIDARIQALQRQLAPYTAMDEHLATASELLGEALIQIQEAASELGHAQDRQELDPEAYARVAERMGALHDLARKHRVEPAQLPEHLAALKEELAALERADEDAADLRHRLEETAAAWREAAGALFHARATTGERLAREVTELMQGLGLAGGALHVTLTPREGDHPHPDGAERIQFEVTTNPGHPPAPLARIASGGELSRISLAIQVATAQVGGTPTLVFDEVDVGIGGGVAELVGEKLRLLGERRQVLCVTHLPQVAAQGHHHILIRKTPEEGEVRTRLIPLTGEERVREIARMLGGRTLTERTLDHAREMLASVEA